MRHRSPFLLVVLSLCLAATFDTTAAAAAAKSAKSWHVDHKVANAGSLAFFKAIRNSPVAVTTLATITIPIGEDGVNIPVEGSDFGEYVHISSIQVTGIGPAPSRDYRIAYRGRYRLKYVADRPTLDHGPFSFVDFCENSDVRHLTAWITPETSVITNNNKPGNEEELLLQTMIRAVLTKRLSPPKK